MTAAREAILARVRTALADLEPRHPSDDVPAPSAADAAVLAERFADRVREYRARVVVTSDPAAAIADVLRAEGAVRAVIAPDLEPPLRPAGVELVEDDGLAPRQLDELDAAVGTCAWAAAETGTIALDGGPGQGRRALSLVPDLHVCVVRADQIVADVPELLAHLEPSARAGRPIVLVSGPSATSDIGLVRIEGVHGPRRLVVVLVR